MQKETKHKREGKCFGKYEIQRVQMVNGKYEIQRVQNIHKLKMYDEN